MSGPGAAGASYGDLLVTSLIALGGVCIAAFLIVRLAGRWLATGRARGGHLMGVVARLPLEPRRSLYVVEVAGKALLVGTSELGLSLLSELDAGELRAREPVRPSFAELVRAAWLRRPGRAVPEPPGHEPAPDLPAPARWPGAPEPIGAGSSAGRADPEAERAQRRGGDPGGDGAVDSDRRAERVR
jgi:flagellar protein FliO/FliZ